MEEPLKGEDHKESNPIISILLEELLDESPSIEPSPKFLELDDFIKDLADQYPQEESHPVVLIDDLFPEISDPFFHTVNPVDTHQPHKVNLISPGLIHDTPSCIPFYPINPEPFSCQTNPESTSYFLPSHEFSYISLTIHLHHVEVCMLHSFLAHVRFASYFLHTLWHLLEEHSKFSCACHARVKPNKSIIYLVLSRRVQ